MVVAVYTIGQTPRPDLTDVLRGRLDGMEFRLFGLLDGLQESDLPADQFDYPLETRLRDGTRVIVDARFLGPRLQAAVSTVDESVRVHLVLCAGPFPNLTSEAPIIQPFETGVSEMERRGFISLEIVVPFAAQAAPAAHKWRQAGFRCRGHDLGGKPESASLSEWLETSLAGHHADALVFDYVGLPPDLLDAAKAAVELPVFDLGCLAMDALERTLGTTRGMFFER